ncbi:two-component system response regulator [Methyloversatilis sp.]|uniref:response regulator n=1 Tax=Methyloversatilis sp. TaxID=2569862 RepID=UPI0035B2592D
MTHALRTVMLIDDNDADNFFHGLMIERSGKARELLVFEWAEKALAWFKAHPVHDVDLVLLDINMPRMNGFEFLEHFHLLPEEHQADTRICMLSSSPLEADRDRALAYPRVRDFVVKPLGEDILHQLASTRDIRR